jgi:hypothetical protein
MDRALPPIKPIANADYEKYKMLKIELVFVSGET